MLNSNQISIVGYNPSFETLVGDDIHSLAQLPLAEGIVVIGEEEKEQIQITVDTTAQEPMIHIYKPETEQFAPPIEDESIKAVAQLEAALVKKTGCYISLSCKKLSCIDFRGADQLA